MEICTFKILLILLGISCFVTSKPLQLEEDNNSEIGDSDYNSNDDSASDEYQEDEALDEAPQNRNVVPVGQDLKRNLKLVPDRRHARNRYEELSGKSNPDRQRQRKTIANLEHLKTDSDNEETNEEADAEKINKDTEHYKKNTELGDTNIKEKPFASDYVDEPLFKVKQEGYNTDRIEYINEQLPREQLRRVKEIENSHKMRSSGCRGRKYDLEINRNRRQAPNAEVTDNNSTPSQKQDIDSKGDSESSIIKNIKKLSEQDLEELLNSLPEDKKNILKKIMEKREITKKAGAVEENYLEGGQSDTSKNEGGFLLDSSTTSEPPFSSSTDTTDISKHTDIGDAESTKTSENENESGKLQDKSLFINSKEPNLNVGYVISDDNLKDEEPVKSENKREIVQAEYSNDNENGADNVENADLKDESCIENDELLPQKGDKIKTNANKREVSDENPSELNGSIQSLEESFSSDTTGESLSPLIRVKRTEKDHSCNKRDSNNLSNMKVPFSPAVESGGSENDERSEIEDYGILDRSSNYERSEENNNGQEKVFHETPEIYGRDLKFNPIEHSGKDMNAETGKACLGSDTDSVLSGVEGIDDNLMYNSGLRNKRTEVSSDLDDSHQVQLNRNGRTAGSLDDSNNAVTDNSINVHNYGEEEAFGPISRNYEGDNSRFKRIRQIKDTPIQRD
ncbi:hypothetical protein KGM_208403 [Danaus plexippus plexippus]|uniref:Uncharacterized protein n=1 Tax=Danaus plexippus plexippus TaxID=278856 RepID=A0A212FFZ3_DANPL|nr:hypothetical protein KGM_208403 [Danaus plexippus plexippus]